MARKKNKHTRTPALAPTPTGWQEAWRRLPEHIQHLICLGLLLAVALGFFAPALFSGKQLVGSDTVHWRATAESMLAYEAETGHPALWATRTFGGMPGFMIYYATQIPQVDDVARLLRHVAWPVSHFIFLLAGTYFLVVFLTRDKWSGVLAACAYGLTTYLPVLLIAGHNSKFVSLCLAPWLVLAFAYALRTPKLLSGLLFAAALAANLRAGHVQITYYIAFLLGVWWLVEAVGALRHGRLKAFGATTGWLVIGGVLGLMMVAQPYLANAEYKAYTIRGAATGGEAAGLGWDYAMSWSQGLSELITLAVAGAYGGGGGTYWGPKIFTAGPHYVGGIVVLLALLAVWRLRKNIVWALGLSGLLMILFSLGENFPALNRLMFDYFPLFDAFRVPETWLSTVAFTLAGLAGLGLYYVVRPETSAAAEQQKTRSVYIAAGTMVALVLVLLLMKDVFFDFERPNEYLLVVQQIASSNNVPPDDPRVATAADRYLAEAKVERADTFAGDAMRTFVFLVLAGLALAAFRAGKLPGWTMQVAVALLVVIDLWGVGRRYVNEDVLVRAPDAEAQIPTYDFDRYILEQKAAAGGDGHFRVLSLEGDPSKVARPSYHYESLGGYHGAKLRLYQDFLDHILFDSATGLPNRNALSILNTRYVAASGAVPGLEVVYQGEQTGFAVLENPAVLPRAFFVGETEVVETPEATWARLQRDTFDPRTTVLLPAPIDFQTTPLDSSSVAEVVLEAYGPREIVWRVRTDAPRLLVVSEVYYPAGWTATLDETPVPIHRADYLLRAVPVPAGEHTLTMRFNPRSHTLGLWVAGASTGLVYGLILVLLGLAWNRRRIVAPEPDGQP